MDEKKQQGPGIYRAICGVMEDIGAVGKNGVNRQQGFKFRSIDDVMNALHPAMVKNRVFIVPQILEQMRETKTTRNGAEMTYTLCKIQFTFFAEDGSFVEAVVTGEGMDSGDKSTNKAMSTAYKYACFQVFCIPTEEMVDPDAECPQEAADAGRKASAKEAGEKKGTGATVSGQPKASSKAGTSGTDPGEGNGTQPSQQPDGGQKITAAMLAAVRAEMERTGVQEKVIYGVHGIKARKLEDLTVDEFKIIMNKFKLTADKPGRKDVGA